jgi:DNA-binding beta-propeller fold protein YncE
MEINAESARRAVRSAGLRHARTDLLPTTRQLLVALALLACASAFSGVVQAAGRAKPDGRPVVVTPEMIGAGVVSSGVSLPAPPPVTGSREAPTKAWDGPLPYPIVIADRRNNRLIEIAPDKRIVWEFPSPNLRIYRGNDDVFFSPDGRRLMVNEEDNYDIHIVDYDKRELTWTFGASDTRGRKAGYFDFPDDAHLLADGNVVTADIRNCRLQFIDPRTSTILREWGTSGRCKHDPPRAFAYPNGATPLDNGDLLVTEITNAWITRLTREGKVVWSVRAPHVRYPSDAFPARGDQIIVADFTRPGRIVIFDPKTGRVSWDYHAPAGEAMLNHPSLALELPNGNIVANDDQRHRVVVIDRATKAIVWQYGVTDTPGHAPGFLFYPDGMDLDVFRDWKATLSAR